MELTIVQNWTYATPEKMVVNRVWSNGRIDSCLVVSDEVQMWLAEGNLILESEV